MDPNQQPQQPTPAPAFINQSTDPTPAHFKNGKLKWAAIIGLIGGVLGMLGSVSFVALALVGETAFIEEFMGTMAETDLSIVVIMLVVSAILSTFLTTVSIITLRAKTLAKSLKAAKVLFWSFAAEITFGFILDVTIGELSAPSIFSIVVMLLVILWSNDLKKAGAVEGNNFLNMKPTSGL